MNIFKAKYYILTCVMSCVLNLFINGQTIKPLFYWTFEGKEQGADILQNKELNIRSYKCSYLSVSGMVGNGINLGNATCLATTGVLKKNISDEFSIEFLFKGKVLSFLTFGQQALIIRFGYGGFTFVTNTATSDGKTVVDNFNIPLKGAGRESYNYYIDNNWHHLVFTASLKTGKKEVYVDGEFLPSFSKTITKGTHFIFGDNDGFRNTDNIDELAFYDRTIPSGLIIQHYMEALEGRHYTFAPSKIKDVLSSRSTAKQVSGVDTLEFAPGYPEYTVQATVQLKSFPLPRFNPTVPVKRNMSWMDINYLHLELPHEGGKGFGKVNPARAIELEDEMAKNWNYYLDIPVLRTSAEAASKAYLDKKSLPGALSDFARHNPQYPWSAILVQAQSKPVHAGFKSGKAYVLSQELEEKYYLRNNRGQAIIQSGRKIISPLTSLDFMEKDGLTSRFYLDQTIKALGRPPALINENGETFGHIIREGLLKQDPNVWKSYQQSGLTESQYSGWFQNRLDSVYRSAVMQGFDPDKTKFSFYNLSAFNAAYWPDYAQRRRLNRWSKDTVYSTPDFYPCWPDNWQNAKGAFNGYGPVAEGRVREIMMGDKFFSPFVSAGWGGEEQNIRPAQWLALLKAMVMLGADFFYTGYFNVTGAGGKWANGVGPNDPRGYAYQIAMPAYAQAVRTWVPEFFEKGELLNPAAHNDLTHQFRFKGKGENELILVRKYGKKYLIYGSIQPNSNIKGNVPLSKITSIELEGKTISFEIRRQGSMYVLDFSGADTVFYQLDGWHQYEHPWYWSTGTEIEAELFSEKNGDVKIKTEYAEMDQSDGNVSFCLLDKEITLTYQIKTGALSEQRIAIMARSRNGAARTLSVEVNDAIKQVTVNRKRWDIYTIKFDRGDKNDLKIKIYAPSGEVDVDKLLIE